MRSARRPGQATTISARPRNAATCGRCGVPPKMTATVSPMAPASGDKTASTWVASSRVGTSTRPRGRQAIVCPPASLATSGREKPSVLPEPVWAHPEIRPAGTWAARRRLDRTWRGNAVRARTVTRAVATPRAANVVPGARDGAGCCRERRGRAVRGWPAGAVTGSSAGRTDKRSSPGLKWSRC